MDRLNDDQHFEPQDLLKLAEKFESPNDETRQSVTHDLAVIAFRAIQTELGRIQLANLLNPNDDTDRLTIQNGNWANEYEQALDQLVEVKETLDLLLKTTKTSLWQWDATTGDKTVDDGYYAMTDFTKSKLEKFNSEQIEIFLTHPDDLKKSDELISACINGDIDNYEFESRIKCHDGTWTLVKDTVQITHRDEHGDVTKIIGIRTDVNELNKAKIRNKQFLKTFVNTELGIALGVNDRLQIGMNNYAFWKMYGYSVNELSFIDLFAPELRTEIENDISKHNESFHKHAESEHIKKDGSRIQVIFDLHIEKDSDGKIIFSSINVIDISELKKLEAEVIEKALHDNLTGLYSRNHLNEQSGILNDLLIEHRISHVSIITIDIDGLKIVNDTYGHTAGDKLLKKMGGSTK
jgi:PAS domain S-box-containing protein